MGLTPKEVGRLFASVPHTCEYCVGCEVEPCEGSGCNSFLLSERRVVDRLCELVKADKEGRCVVLTEDVYLAKIMREAAEAALKERENNA